jgi:hypothetical protein
MEIRSNSEVITNSEKQNHIFESSDTPIAPQVETRTANDDDQIAELGIASKRVFDSLADFINKLPFAGRLTITPTTMAAIKERNIYYKTVKTIEASAVLGFMVLAHAFQTHVGIQALQENLEHLDDEITPEKLLACGIDVAYIAANCAATYAQLHLSGRLAEHFMRTSAKSVPWLAAWGINNGEVDYDIVAEKLMIAMVNDDQADIDTFFMILPKEKKQQAMESIRAITEVIDETYSYEEIGQRIAKLEKNVEQKSRFRYIFDIVINAHKNYAGKSPYTFKEQMKSLIVTIGGTIGFQQLG